MINTLRLFATRFGCCRYAFFHTPSPGSLEKGIRLFQGEPRPSPAADATRPAREGLAGGEGGILFLPRDAGADVFAQLGGVGVDVVVARYQGARVFCEAGGECRVVEQAGDGVGECGRVVGRGE